MTQQGPHVYIYIYIYIYIYAVPLFGCCALRLAVTQVVTQHLQGSDDEVARIELQEHFGSVPMLAYRKWISPFSSSSNIDIERGFFHINNLRTFDHIFFFSVSVLNNLTL